MLKKGFTLAEVLITITILGIIAAVAMPALKSDMDKHSWAQGLKVNYYEIQQGFQRMLADQEADSLADTELGRAVPLVLNYDPRSSSGGGEGGEEDDEKTATNDAIKAAMSKYFAIQKMEIGVSNDYPIKKYCGENYGNGNHINKSIRFYLDNGAIMYISFGRYGDAASIQRYGSFGQTRIHLDVNGDKGPNTMGKDIFYFIKLTDDGKLVAYGSQEGNYHWDTLSTASSCTNEAIRKKNSRVIGSSCTGRIIEQGFRITY